MTPGGSDASPPHLRGGPAAVERLARGAIGPRLRASRRPASPAAGAQRDFRPRAEAAAADATACSRRRGVCGVACCAPGDSWRPRGLWRCCGNLRRAAYHDDDGARAARGYEIPTEVRDARQPIGERRAEEKPRPTRRRSRGCPCRRWGPPAAPRSSSSAITTLASPARLRRARRDGPSSRPRKRPRCEPGLFGRSSHS